VAVDGILPVPIPIGEPAIAVGGIMDNRTAIRWEFEVECVPFAVRATSYTTGDLQDYGVFLKLASILAMPNVWIYATRYSADSAASDPIPRAGEHAWNVDGANTFWSQKTDTPAGLLPCPVVLIGEARPERQPGGKVGLTFTLQKRTPGNGS
jgi:hypothetical protein